MSKYEHHLYLFDAIFSGFSLSIKRERGSIMSNDMPIPCSQFYRIISMSQCILAKEKEPKEIISLIALLDSITISERLNWVRIISATKGWTSKYKL